jgi:hypothetical protein
MKSTTKQSNINPYRERCRKLVAGHPKLHRSHKFILMRMTDYVNRHSYEAFVGEKTLAEDCAVNPRSVRRAKEAAIEHGILECTQKGNQYIGASRYVFNFPPSAEDTSASARDTLQSAEDTWDSAKDTWCPPITSESRTSENQTSENKTPQAGACVTPNNGPRDAKEQQTVFSSLTDDSRPSSGSISQDHTTTTQAAAEGSFSHNEAALAAKFPEANATISGESQAAKSQAFVEAHKELILWATHTARINAAKRGRFEFPQGILNHIAEHGLLTDGQIATAERFMAKDRAFQQAKNKAFAPSPMELLEKQRQQQQANKDDPVFSSDGEWFRKVSDGVQGPFKTQQEARALIAA